VPIIQHPDVRRMLLTMKAYVEGMRSLLYYVGLLRGHDPPSSDDPAEKTGYQGMIEVLTPLPRAMSPTVLRGLQPRHAGLRRLRLHQGVPPGAAPAGLPITMIYEGTNGIQAMDLLGRKLGMNKGKPIMDLMGEMQKTMGAAVVSKRRTRPSTRAS
jgi:alkylation response protein AidB-like acyl-CoA dehydrogenase